MTMLTETAPRPQTDFLRDPDTEGNARIDPLESSQPEQIADAEADRRQAASLQLGHIMGAYVTIEQLTYKNGARHVYGIDENGKKRHISYDKVLMAYGYQPETPKQRKSHLQQTTPDTSVTPHAQLTPEASSAEDQSQTTLTPRVHIWPTPPEQPSHRLSLRGAKSWMNDKLETAREQRSRLRPIHAFKQKRADKRSASYHYPYPESNVTLAKVGTAAVALASVVGATLVVADLTKTETVVVEQPFASPEGFNGNGTVVCGVVAHSDIYAQCDMEKPIVEAYHRKMADQNLPHHQAPVAPTVSRPVPSPAALPTSTVLSRSGEGVWSAVETLSYNGGHLTPAHVAQATDIELAYNHIPAERADKLPFNLRLQIAPAVAKMLLADSSATK